MSARRLWLAIMLGPLAWLAYLEIAYALVPLACRHPSIGLRIALYGIAAAALAAAVAAVALAWPAWRATGHAEVDQPAPEGRVRFLAMTGVGSGVLFVLVMIAGSVPLLLLPPCE